MTHHLIPQLAPLYAALGPWAEAALRVAVGLCLVPHALRSCFGLFPGTGMPITSMAELAKALEGSGYRPGRLWGPVVVATELVGGPLLALGLLTRPVSVPVFILLVLSIREHGRFGWFWNKQGCEYPVIWAAGSLYFLLNGGGPVSLDRLIGWEF